MPASRCLRTLYVRKSQVVQRQNAHFVCIAKRVTGHGVNSNMAYAGVLVNDAEMMQKG